MAQNISHDVVLIILNLVSHMPAWRKLVISNFTGTFLIDFVLLQAKKKKKTEVIQCNKQEIRPVWH